MFDKFSFTIVSLVESVIWNCIRYPEVPPSHLDVVWMSLERDRGGEVEADPHTKIFQSPVCGSSSTSESNTEREHRETRDACALCNPARLTHG